MILDEQSNIFLTLKCKHCEYVECPIVENGKLWRGKQGCTRKVPEETADVFIHYTEEVIPFWKTYTLPQVKRSYNEIINFLYEEVYSAPLGQKLGPDGKVRLTR